jgi:hypothetical protein
MMLDHYSDRKMGRPSKLTPEVVGKLLKALADGLTLEQAATSIGVHRDTLRRWREEHPWLNEQLEQAREECRRKMLGVIKSAAESGDPKAAETFLRMSFFPYYTKPDTSVNVGVQAGMGIICDEPTRDRLIALQRQLLGGQTKQLPENARASNDTQDATPDAPHMGKTTSEQIIEHNA